MTDMPEFRAWADREHRSLMSEPKRKKRKTRYRCVNPACDYRTTESTAYHTNGQCYRCGSDLLSKQKFL